LKLGHIYRKRDGSLHVFLGKVKHPGAEKTSFAFVKLPEKPFEWDGVDLAEHDGEHGIHMREERDVAKKWNQMTWQERCQWEWYDRTTYLYRQYKDVEPGYYDHPGEIVLMASPKFEEELAETATELATQLRENAGAKHKYVNGKGDDLAELHFKANSGNERRWDYWPYSHMGYPGDWHRISDAERRRLEREHHANVKQEYIAYRQSWQKQLSWM